MLNALRSPIWYGVVALVIFLVYLNWPAEDQQRRGGPRATPVITQVVSQQALPITVEALGTGRANESITIAAQDSEVIETIYFDDGQQVSKETLLIQLNATQEKARFNEVQTNLDEALRQLTRLQNLAQTNATSKQLLDEQNARVEALRAQLAVAQANLADKQITAPFSGVLGLRNVSTGAFVRAGEVLTTLDDLSVLKMDFALPEKHLATVAVGQEVFATTSAYPNETFAGKITSIDSRIDPVTRSINVRTLIDNADGRLRPGILLKVVLLKDVLHTLVIDEKALVPDEDRQFVFKVVDGKAVKTQVQLGVRRPGKVQILDGLVPGDEVVIQGTLRIRDGSSLNILSREG